MGWFMLAVSGVYGMVSMLAMRGVDYGLVSMLAVSGVDYGLVSMLAVSG